MDLTWSALLTPAGVVLAAAGITALTELLKTVWPGIHDRVNGLQIAFVISALLYAVATSLSVQEQSSADLVLVGIFAWISCATSAVGIHQTAEKITTNARHG